MWESIDELLKMFTPDKVVGGNIYLEVEHSEYEKLLKEAESKAIQDLGVKYIEDIGICKKFNYGGYKVCISWNKDVKTKKEEMFVGFKVKSNDRVQDNSGGQT